MGVRGKATMSTKCSSGAVPGGVLVTLPPRAKSLAARRRRNSPAKRTIQRPDEGIGPYKKRSIIATSSGPFGATFPIPPGLRPSPFDKGSRPPRGRLKKIGGEAPAETQGEKAQTPQSLRESGQRKEDLCPPSR